MGWNEIYEAVKSLDAEVRIQANNETKNLNVFRFTGTIQIVTQYAEIMSVVNASNMTNVYADIWDGINSEPLTKSGPGADFSGLCTGSFFSKLGSITEEYYINFANQARVTDIDPGDVGHPFVITAKHGVDNFIRFNFTTNTVLDFVMKVFFRYRIINGGSLEFV
jgi:hypothetical protein